MIADCQFGSELWSTQPVGTVLDGCDTFRDLAHRLAGQPPRRRIQPSR